ncbi:hypothetical protein Tco_0505450, partial [Tanacetum coccineum]
FGESDGGGGELGGGGCESMCSIWRVVEGTLREEMLVSQVLIGTLGALQFGGGEGTLGGGDVASQFDVRREAHHFVQKKWECPIVGNREFWNSPSDDLDSTLKAVLSPLPFLSLYFLDMIFSSSCGGFRIVSSFEEFLEGSLMAMAYSSSSLSEMSLESEELEMLEQPEQFL